MNIRNIFLVETIDLYCLINLNIANLYDLGMGIIPKSVIWGDTLDG